MTTTRPDPSVRAHADRPGSTEVVTPGRVVTAVLAALVLAAGALGAVRATRSGVQAVRHGPYEDINEQEAGLRCLTSSLGEQVPPGARVVVEQHGEEPVFWTQRVSAMAFENGITVTDRAHADVVASAVRSPTPGPCGVFRIDVAPVSR